MDARQKVVSDLAEKMGRTSSSVAMKLVNLASLDPALKLRGIKGLSGSSILDRETWDEYHKNAIEIIPLAQEMFDALFIDDERETTEVLPGEGIRSFRRTPVGATESKAFSKRRIGQGYFRDVVLNNYDGCCGVTELPIRELLVASHILPWSENSAERLSVHNGISLNRLHDAAFDRNLISFNDDLCLVLSPKLKTYLSSNSVVRDFEAYEGKALCLPQDGIPPNFVFLSSHRMKLAIA
jgi:putative restriction endonuclease